MTPCQKNTLRILILIGILYFVLMLFPNLTGARTPEMLSVFEVDEYAQYSHVIDMLTPGSSFYQSLRNFFVYLHYFYGYPFYFWSALFLLPVRILGGADWTSHTRLIVCLLRQMISVLPMILSALILTSLGTKFKDRTLSILTFLFLLLLPAVVTNDFWWHPDSLALFFAVLTFFFLEKDAFRGGKYFYFAAAACGAATGTKYTGLYFCLAIPLYLVLAVLRRTLSAKKAAGRALLFLLIMAVFVVITNPLLLLPQERAEIIRVQKLQAQETGTGIFTVQHASFFDSGLIPDDIRRNYGGYLIVALTLAGMLALIFRGSRDARDEMLVLSAYLLVAALVPILSASRRLHYFLPVLLPFFAALSAAYRNIRSAAVSRGMKKLLMGICLLSVMYQFGMNISRDVTLYQSQLRREADSASIALYQEIREQLLPALKMPENRMLRIFRDWKVYYPETPGKTVVNMNWEMITLDQIEDWHPDLIILEKENIRMFSDPSILENAVNQDRMQAVQHFYALAASDAIPDFHAELENSFGTVYVKNEIAGK